MIAERGMRRSLTTIFDRFFLEDAHATSEPRAQSLRDLLLPLLQLVSESDVLRADSLGNWRSGGDPFFCRDLSFNALRTRSGESKLASSLDYTAMSREASSG